MTLRTTGAKVGRNLRSEASVGDTLGNAARDILAAGRAAIDDRSLSDAQTVHEVRKALKRWRALMRLLARPLGEPAEQSRIAARNLMRTLSQARDGQSALDALADLGKGTTLSPASLKTIHDRLDDLKRSAESVFTRETRNKLRRYIDAATISFDNWPLGEIGFAAIAEGLTVTYRRARRLVPDVWAEAEAEDLHDLRRRVVEHRHQMDLIEPLWPRLNEVWAQEAQRLRNRLGACQDLAVLEALAAPHQPLAHWRARLVPVIAARKAAHIKAAKRLAGRLFAEKPKAFCRRIEALWDARTG
jgi:CHAD domain-containing protein